MLKLTISAAPDSKDGGVRKLADKINLDDIGERLLLNPLFTKSVLSPLGRAVQQIEEEYQCYHFSEDEKWRIAHRAITLAQTKTFTPFNMLLHDCVMDAQFGENRVKFR